MVFPTWPIPLVQRRDRGDGSRSAAFAHGRHDTEPYGRVKSGETQRPRRPSAIRPDLTEGNPFGLRRRWLPPDKEKDPGFVREHGPGALPYVLASSG